MVINTCSNAFGYKGRWIEDTEKKGNGTNIFILNSELIRAIEVRW